MKITARLLLATSIVLAAASAGCGGRTDVILGLDGDSAAGGDTYGSRCEVCHGADGTSGSASVDITASSDDKLVNEVLNGNNEGMQSFAELSDQEIADVLAFVRTL